MFTPIRRCTLPLFLGLLASLLWSGQAQAAKLTQQQSNLQQQLSSLLSQLSTLQQQITTLQQQLTTASGNQQAISNLQQQRTTMQQTINGWQKQLTTYQQQLSTVTGNTQNQQQTTGTGQQQTNGQCQGQSQGQGQGQTTGQNQSPSAQLNSLAKQLKAFQTQNTQQSNRVLRSLLDAQRQAGTMVSTTQNAARTQQTTSQAIVLRRLRR